MRLNRFTSIAVGIMVASLLQLAQAAKIIEADKNALTLQPSYSGETFSIGELGNVIEGASKKGMARITSFENGRYKAELVRGVAPIGAEVLSNDNLAKRSDKRTAGGREAELKVTAWRNMMPDDGSFPETKRDDHFSIVIQTAKGKISLKQVSATTGKTNWKTTRFNKTSDGYQIDGALSAPCDSEIKIEIEFKNEATKRDERRIVKTHLDCQY